MDHYRVGPSDNDTPTAKRVLTCPRETASRSDICRGLRQIATIRKFIPTRTAANVPPGFLRARARHMVGSQPTERNIRMGPQKAKSNFQIDGLLVSLLILQ